MSLHCQRMSYERGNAMLKARRQRKKRGFRTALVWMAVYFAAVSLMVNALAMQTDDSAPAQPNPGDPQAAIVSRDWYGRVYPEVKEGFLPVCFGRRAGDKSVALTIDDCNQADNLMEMIDLIDSYGGEATIFPIGENAWFLKNVLRSAVARGFEIENHTMSHSGLFYETDEEMAYQIWQQNAEVNKALGVNYQMHFLRPRGGDNRYDQRTHAYMRQMGYYGIAYWSQIGSNNTADNLMANMKPGDIILFHTTDEDLEIMKALVPRLWAAGYRMVTLNDLYGLEDNAQTPLQTAAEPMPLEAYERFDQTLERNDFLRDVYLLQQELSRRGYTIDKVDGIYGAVTERAIRAFQTDCGLPVSGKCDPETWNALFAQNVMTDE